MYKNVMLPVDGSTFSREAVLHGVRIASQTGATLRLVRVAVSPVFLGGPGAAGLEAEALREARSSELSELYAIAAECRAHSTVSVTASLERGPVIDALVGYAKREKVDLIVMRSHARGGLARAWFGSTADGLIRESGIPVLVVRPPSVATGMEGGATYRRILVPLDGSELAEQALAPAVTLARMEGASLTLLRIVSAWKRRVAGELESALGPASANEVSQAQRYLDSLLTSDADRSLHISRRVVIADDVASAILEIADYNESDLIAIATRGRGALRRAAAGSVSDQVMRASPVSTIVVHPIATAEEVPASAQKQRSQSGAPARASR